MKLTDWHVGETFRGVFDRQGPLDIGARMDRSPELQDQILSGASSPMWYALVRVMQDMRRQAYIELAEPSNNRERDLFLKSGIAMLENLLQLPGDAKKMVDARPESVRNVADPNQLDEE